MLDFFKPEVEKVEKLAIPVKFITAEEIHAEIDKTELSLKELLVDTGVSSNSHIIKKSELATELGFTSIEVVDKAKTILKKEESIRVINEESSKFNELASLYRFEYPLDKILSRDQFKSIMDKYSLVNADVSQYIKDVPEQVLLNVKNSKKTKEEHKVKNKSKVLDVSFQYHFYSIDNRDVKLEERIIEYLKVYGAPKNNRMLKLYDLPSFLSQGSAYNIQNIFINNVLIIKESELQVAAPKSHFNSSYINQLESKITSNVMTDDPIVFQFLEGGFVRIIDKWGTEDDQSYLDPALTNEILN